MLLALTLEAPASSVDVVISADETTTVGAIAQALAARHPDRPVPPGEYTLRERGAPAPLDVSATLQTAGLRSGLVVGLEAVSSRFAVSDTAAGPPAAVLRILQGPDAGREFPLHTGAVLIGRDLDLGIRLSDPQVSKRHARIVVTDTIEIVDAGSTNGILVDGLPVTRAPLADGTSVQVGDTVMMAVPYGRLGESASLSPTVDVVRSPRVVPDVPETQLAAPLPPQEPTGRRFPLIALVAPIAMGLVLFSVNRNPLSLIFVALSPVIMIGTWLDAWTTARGTIRSEAARFEGAVAAVQADIDAALARERELRHAAYPSTSQVAESIELRGPLLWSRRTEHEEFAGLRIGLAHLPSRCEVTGDDAGAKPEHRRVLRALAESARVVRDVPLVADLRFCGGVGLAGPRERVVDVARACVLQLAGLHAPQDLMLAAFVSPRTLPDWQWLAWLPHTRARREDMGNLLAADVGGGTQLLATLEELVETRLSSRGTSQTRPTSRRRATGERREASEVLPPAVVVLVEDGTPVDRGRLTALAERGPDVEVYVLWVARTARALPAACRTFLQVDGDGTASAGFVRDGLEVEVGALELLSAARAIELARALAPVVDAGASADDVSGLPSSVSFLSIVGPELGADPGLQVDRWRESGSLTARDSAPRPQGKAGSLRAVVGQAGTEPLVLDLRSQGPHALVGGTTGAGKSEFLQTWVLGMATAHSPDRVTFLFVDYKGGAAFGECVRLPHAVGLVTDLSTHLVRRALTSLRAELRYREHLLNAKNAKDLQELEKRGDPDAPPSLIIVVDEFAALASDVPEFVDGVVDVAQRGRSLGLHLILATQRPAGVIKDNLRANTNLRVALRMADEDDSNDVLGSPMAAHVDPGLPGRSAVRTGPGRIVAFQAAYAGGRTSLVAAAPRIDVVELGFGRGRPWASPQPTASEDSSLPTDISAVVHNVREAADLAGVPEPRKPWLPILATAYDLARLSQRSDARISFGVADDPDRQDQRTTYFLPDQEGHLAVYGASGTGKSVLLRTLAAAATITPRGGPVHVYGLDFAGGALGPLEVLPSVGSIVSGDDTERVTRLLTWLRGVVDERAVRYPASRASTLAEYRDLAQAPDEPRYLLLIDGFGAFRTEYESVAGRSGAYQLFQQLLADGRSVGVHVALSADRPGSVPTSVSAATQRVVVLRQADENSYLTVNAPRDVLSSVSPPGRAIDLPEGLETQVAVLGGDPNLARQARALERLAQAIPPVAARRAPPILRLPEVVPAAQLPAEVTGLPLLGIADDTLAPVGFDPTGTFLISGPSASGRTTTVLQLARALRRWRPTTVLVHLAGRASPLVGNSVWTRSERGADAVAALIAEALPRFSESSTAGAPPVVLIVEALTDFLGTPVESALTELIKQAKRNGHLVLAESDSASWGSTWPLVTEVRSGRRGIALQPDQMEGDLLFRTSFPRIQRTEFPPGRGLVVQSGRVRRIQIPLPDGAA